MFVVALIRLISYAYLISFCPQIGHIEVRTDESYDLRDYIHRKSFDLQTVPLSDQLRSLRDRFAKLMNDCGLTNLVNRGVIRQRDPILLHPYSCQLGNKIIPQLPGGKNANGALFGVLSIMGSMARAMGYLLEESISAFHDCLLELNAKKSVASKPAFKEILAETEQLRRGRDYVAHPKIDVLRSMTMQHFVEAEAEGKETRVMVFCQYRQVVEEVRSAILAVQSIHARNLHIFL
jgi:ERCC4-related helicase